MSKAARYLSHTNFSHGKSTKVGILLTNLGTPDAPERSALRRYLKEFLWDPRVVEFPRWLWWFILNGVILNIRPARSAVAYAKIWTPQGSPLLSLSKRLIDAVTPKLKQLFSDNCIIKLAMRYGSPSIPQALQQMREDQVSQILVLPLYPQYSGSTTGSTFDAIVVELKRWRWVPELRFVNGYHDNPVYIDCLKRSIQNNWKKTSPGDLLLISFHGIPKRYLLQGDPYYCQCQTTARLLAQSLDLSEDRWKVVFQSRFGREPWLQPYCDEVLQVLPAQGIKTIDIICPGFSIDCLETLEEIQIQNQSLFESAGGEGFRYIPCLNDSEDHQELIEHLIDQHTEGWKDQIGMNAQTLNLRLERAIQHGANY